MIKSKLWKFTIEESPGTINYETREFKEPIDEQTARKEYPFVEWYKHKCPKIRIRSVTPVKQKRIIPPKTVANNTDKPTDFKTVGFVDVTYSDNQTIRFLNEDQLKDRLQNRINELEQKKSTQTLGKIRITHIRIEENERWKRSLEPK